MATENITLIRGTISNVTGQIVSTAAGTMTEFMTTPTKVNFDDTIYEVRVHYYTEAEEYADVYDRVEVSPLNITQDSPLCKIGVFRQDSGYISDVTLAELNSGGVTIETGSEPPVPQEEITSAKSGNWEETSTWVGGVVPVEATHVIITAGHVVTVTANTTNTNKVTVRGTLTVNDTIDFMIGNTVENKACEFVIDGGTINGTGSLFTLNGSISSTNTSWSYIRDVTIKSSENYADNGDFFYDLQNCSVITNSTVSFGQTTTRGASLVYDNAINFENCVFKNCANIYLGTGGGSKIKPWKIAKTTFIDVTQIEGSTGNIQSGFEILFDSVVAYHSSESTNWRMLTADADHKIKNSYLMNQHLDTIGSRKVSIDTCYIGTDYSGVILSTNQESSITKSILHQPSTTNSNNQSIRLANGSYNFVESWADGASNIVIHNENAYQSLNWSHNIFIGKGESFTNINDTLVTDSFINNTTYLDNSTIYMTERRYPLDGSSITLKNNLVVDTAENNSAMCRQSNYSGTSGIVNLTVDYNAQYNQSGGLFGAGSATLVNTVDGANNIVADPKFIDPTRSVLSWGATKSLSSITAIWTYFVSANGYNATTEAHTDSTHSATEIEEIRAWLFGGYIPQNSTLVGSGEGGTYIGAVMPQIEPVIGGYYWCGIGQPAKKIENVVIIR